ncbi:uncharacterized protein LOC121055313 [Oryza brachyantha]|uniref:uncharacterized protein LOC121055313 n=1 Tax=Oryza brachyantha TaxID=4533 RepID=UPI001ADC9F0B|nr:uncharacterized protein LOC121055313 [Oryza brachyantha]
MGVAYRRLTACESRRGGGGGAAAAAAARAWWAAVRRASAAGLARLCCAAAGRRRWWRASRRRRLGLAGRAAGRYEYDSAGYARNFDDGVWKAEEGVFWSAGAATVAACRHTAIVPCAVDC